jgi:quinol monooxygenase YgiN
MADQVIAALQEMAPLVKQHEPGCPVYQVARSHDDPDLLLLCEHYVDEAALQAHRETPHFKQIIEGRVIPLLEKRERELYDLVVG